MQLAPNVYRIETQARGSFSVGREGEATPKRAAELTLANGHTHFVLVDATVSSVTAFGGISPTYSTTNVSVYGNTGYGRSTVYGGTPIYVPTGQAGATVIMFRAADPQAANALEAATVLERIEAKG